MDDVGSFLTFLMLPKEQKGANVPKKHAKDFK
jgi:hypothetical protein